jgi:SAM-dependent methyltransferase
VQAIFCHLSLIFSIAYGLELKSEWNERLKTNVDEYFNKNGYPNVSYQLVEVGREFSAFEDGCIDFISAADILEHFTPEQLANFKSESYRVLKKGGILAVSLPSENWIYHIFSSKESGHIANSSKAINSLIDDLGGAFELIDRRYIFPFFKVVCYRKA